MATPPKTETLFTTSERKLLIKALSKLDASTSRFLTTAQKEEDEKSVVSAKETLAEIAQLRMKL